MKTNASDKNECNIRQMIKRQALEKIAESVSSGLLNKMQMKKAEGRRNKGVKMSRRLRKEGRFI